MLYLKSMLNVIDNSGAMLVECIKVLGKSPKNNARIGDRIVVVVQKARPIANASAGGPGSNSGNSQKLRQGDIRHAVVVRTKQPTRRSDGSIIRFDDNACVLIGKSGDPIGSRVSGVVGKELRDKGFNKIVALAPRTV
ncbi:similar to Saccharomyces cerevisiae YKL170W MRPL38 Mitochondrial ribosomal protein of the large subunit [Geotrichum candidum]|uniref:Large ribosomal subunit protein uL14m n=2 Tax=Geotrichum candidum TaxID=1173061 RepID=A0A0J9XGW6_GEOCN|nr:similar to Saccharomyces cerevisiae YKL170W MRPL38 Mitochondrial ribosomal protein of the large subunit [Geotrichum candidum]